MALTPRTSAPAGSIDYQFGLASPRTVPTTTFVVELTSGYSSSTGYSWVETRSKPGTGFYSPTLPLTGNQAYSPTGDTSLVAGTICYMWIDRDQTTYGIIPVTSGGGGAPNWLAPCRVATVTAGTLSSSFENGDTVNGVVLVTGNRILIKDQSSASENGVYTVNSSGSPTRAADADSGPELVNAIVAVSEGTASADSIWMCTANSPITLGSTSLPWVLVYPQTGGSGAPNWLAPCRAATVTDGTLSTDFANGDVIDGITLATGDRILIKDQSTVSQNGTYTVNATGSPTRTTDNNTAAEAVGAVATVAEGTVNAETVWLCMANQFSGTDPYWIKVGPGVDGLGEEYRIATWDINTNVDGIPIKRITYVGASLATIAGGGFAGTSLFMSKDWPAAFSPVPPVAQLSVFRDSNPGTPVDYSELRLWFTNTIVDDGLRIQASKPSTTSFCSTVKLYGDVQGAIGSAQRYTITISPDNFVFAMSDSDVVFSINGVSNASYSAMDGGASRLGVSGTIGAGAKAAGGIIWDVGTAGFNGTCTVKVGGVDKTMTIVDGIITDVS